MCVVVTQIGDCLVLKGHRRKAVTDEVPRRGEEVARHLRQATDRPWAFRFPCASQVRYAGKQYPHPSRPPPSGDKDAEQKSMK